MTPPFAAREPARHSIALRSQRGAAMAALCLSGASLGAAAMPDPAQAPVTPHLAVPPVAQAHIDAPMRGTIDVWVDLSVPPLSTLVHADAGERERLRARVVAQQSSVMRQLEAIGAVEIGRVQLLRNSIAVHLPRDQIGAALRLSGVLSIRRVRHQQLLP